MTRSIPGIAGAGSTAITKEVGAHPFDMVSDALNGALDQARLRLRDVDAVLLCRESIAQAAVPVHAQRLAHHLGISTRALAEFENGGLSGALALRHAMNEVASGSVDVAAVVGVQAEVRGRSTDGFNQAAFLNSMYGPYLAPYGVVSAVPMYALVTQRYMHEHGLGPADIAPVAVTLRTHASQNPRAQFQEPITVEEVLASRVVAPPIHVLESCPLSNGAAVVIVTSAERARQAGAAFVALTGWGEAHDGSSFVLGLEDLARFPAITEACGAALAQAGRALDDIHVAEVWGPFAGPELITYEALGFFKDGEAPQAVRAGRTTFGGDVVLNPSGGRLSLGYPALATPALMVQELYDQLTGTAEGRQVDGASVGLLQFEHGVMNGFAVAVMEA